MFGPGKQISGFVLRARLGEGPFGITWEAVDRTDQSVTVKLLRPAFGERAEGKTAFDRLKRAARAHQRVQHPYVATLSSLVESPEDRALGAVSSFHDGFPLSQLEVSTAARRGDEPSELSRLLFFFEELGDALHWLHERQVVHGNLKPSNVLVQRGDFGIIPKILDLSWSAIGVAASSDNVFISPEQFAGQVPSRASDQWAFGSLLAHTVGSEDPGWGGAPRRLVETVQRMNARQPNQRFSTIKEAVDGLRAVRSELERARVLSRSARFRVESEGHEPPVPGARALGEGESGDLVEPPDAAMSTVDGRLRQAGLRQKEASPLRLAPAALSSRDLDPPEMPQLSVHAHRLRPRAPVYLGIGAALLGGALLLAVITQSGSTVTAEATAEAQEVPEMAKDGVEAFPRDPAGSDAPPPADAPQAHQAEAGEAPPAPVEEPEVHEAPEVDEAPEPEELPEKAPPSAPATAPTAKDCELGSGDACLEAAAWFATEGRDREARDAYEAACDAGRRVACIKAVQWWAGSGLPDADRRTLVLLTKACALNAAQACQLAAERVAAGRGASPDADRVERLRRKACHLGRQASCGPTRASTTGH